MSFHIHLKLEITNFIEDQKARYFHISASKCRYLQYNSHFKVDAESREANVIWMESLKRTSMANILEKENFQEVSAGRGTA